MNKEFEVDVSLETKEYEELILYIVIIVKEIYELQKELR